MLAYVGVAVKGAGDADRRTLATPHVVTMPTLILALFVFAMALLAYARVFPHVAGNDLWRLTLADAALAAIVFAVVGLRFYDTGTRFDFGLFETEWFSATLITLLVSEAILLPGYLRRVGGL